MITANLSLSEVGAINHDMNGVLISIVDHQAEDPTLIRGAWRNVLISRFDDVLSDDPQWIGMGYVPPDEADAALIANFIAVNRLENIFVSCVEGISRSAAVCSVLADYGWEYVMKQPHGLARANPLLMRLLKGALSKIM